ncbi:MAG: DNA-directed RNA polymerase subunit K [Thermoproteales archaeon]|nr:DNA-directed RNA polymerase subunit K [Thermoproteales archaeon]
MNVLDDEFTVKIGPPWLTKYEKARIIGVRALQISLGAPSLIPLEEVKDKDPINIAIRELELKILPIIIRRWKPNGKYQDIPLKYLKY